MQLYSKAQLFKKGSTTWKSDPATLPLLTLCPSATLLIFLFPQTPALSHLRGLAHVVLSTRVFTSCVYQYSPENRINKRHISVCLSAYPSTYLPLNLSRQIYLKELAYLIMETGKPKNSRAASRLETPARVGIAVLVQRLETQAECLCCSLKAEFSSFPLWETSVFIVKAFN